MIRAIIIDDEVQSANTLRDDLASCCPSVHLAGTCYAAKEGILLVRKEKPDLVFLDIQMPWMNGFEMLEALGPISFHIIFTTAYDQFAARAFRLSAVDYLLKPIDLHDLREAVAKVEERMQLQKDHANVENLLQNIRQPAGRQKIALPYKDGYEFVEVANITHCQAEGAYTRVELQDKKHILVCRTLGDIEELLPPGLFLRIHHSTIINTSFVTHFVKADGGYIRMQTGEELSVSKSRREAVMEKLGVVRKNGLW